MSSKDYHKTVADYYDEEAHSFEERARQNPILNNLRQQFRDVVMEGEVENLLEIGYGPGLDMVWFSKHDEVKKVHGLDITPNFQKIVANKALIETKLNPLLGGPETISKHLEPNSIDTIYIFFGALNTCSELESAIEKMSLVLKPGGRVIATFVNKWYAFEILWNLITFRPTKAFARLKKVWTGYSPTRKLDSRCYSARQIDAFFKPHLVRRFRKGYCIAHPAWYRFHWAPLGGIRSKTLFTIDRLLQWTPFWNLGEYSLYVYYKSE